jgi:hydroxymethylbilane synthase
MTAPGTVVIATRGSALALAQANLVLARCRAAFPGLSFELRIIKTTGDKLQTASMAQQGKELPKGLFTKELEAALLERQAHLAVHSLKDLPTELPAGLCLGGVCERADVRDALIYRAADGLPGADRGFPPHLTVQGLPAGAAVATSSTRRKAQLLALRPGLKTPELRGNVLTRLRKLAERAELDATVLALAGLARLNYTVTPQGRLEGDGVPAGLLAAILDTAVMLPCVGQGAIGLEARQEDERSAAICQRLNHYDTLQCVSAERAFLAAMGGGCQSPVAAHAEVFGSQLRLRAAWFAPGLVRRAETSGPLDQPLELGRGIAARLKAEGAHEGR